MSAVSLITNGTGPSYLGTPTKDTDFGGQYLQHADSVYQSVSGLTVGQTYRLSGWAVVRTPNLNEGVTFKLATYETGSFNNGVFEMTTPNLNPQPTTVAELRAGDFFNLGAGVDGWRELVLEFEATSSDMTIMVSKYADAFNPEEPDGPACNWDNISLTAVPEPSAALLLGLAGLTGLLHRRRFSRESA